MPRSSSLLDADGRVAPLRSDGRAAIETQVAGFAERGLRVLGVATRELRRRSARAAGRRRARARLSRLGRNVRSSAPRRRARGCGVPRRRDPDHRDYRRRGLTAAEVARQVGISEHARVVTGAELERLDERALDRLLAEEPELIFARSSPEAKLRVADALRAQGHVVAMTGDGVNDAPALRRADIGIAMGRSGTDVAREASTLVLTDDNFASIVAAVEAGRQVYDNVRKFIVYIFAHAPAEVIPFFVFALSGGLVPLPLTVLQILAIDLGTETLPALALGRERPEPGLMERPPRPRAARTSSPREMLFVRGGFWDWCRPCSSSAGSSPCSCVQDGGQVTRSVPVRSLSHAYHVATAITFAGIVPARSVPRWQPGRILSRGSASASRSNRLLLWGILFEVMFAAAIVYLPALQSVFHTAALGPTELATIAPFPLVVWGVDELYRARKRARLGSTRTM